MNIQMIKSLVSNNNRIPFEYRNNKENALKLINTIIEYDLEIKNPGILFLKKWVGLTNDEEFSRVISVENTNMIEDTVDLSINEGHSYIANGIICHNTINLPENVTVEKVQEIYEAAWESGCKGITVYRKNSRSGVLVDASTNNKEGKIENKTDAIKRPKKLPGEVHHVRVKGNDYYVTIGLMNNDPYEIFIGENHENEDLDTEIKFRIPKRIKSGEIVKIKRGVYNLITDNEVFRLSGNVGSDEVDALTRMISLSLRHFVDVSYTVQQLEKIEGFDNFPKALAKALKRYIKDGTKVSGEYCPSCESHNLIRQDGCVTCADCGWSRC